MDSARWKRLRALYDEVADVPPDRRPAAARRVCGDDEALVADLLRLFDPGSDADALFEDIVADAASNLPSPTLDGTRVGPYRLVSEIGQGGMGSVYLAERVDGQFEQRVALKLIKPGLDAQIFLQRFQAERQILAHLQHPNIARLLDGGMDDEGRLYFALEYVEGQPIDEYCETRDLGIDARLRLFQEVCRAVAYAHGKLVVHRDLKPANILVDGDGRVRLLDFGIAKMVHEDDDKPGLTQVGMRVMTPEYASPEQVRGETVSTATDVYSLGVVLYKLLTGSRPYDFPTRTPVEIERVVCDTAPLRPSAKVLETRQPADREDNAAPAARPRPRRSRRLRGDVDVICLKALQKEPDRRYSSVEALQEDIRRNLAGLPVLARPDSVSYRAGKFAVRHRVGLAIAAAVTVAFAAFGAYHTVRLADERDRAQSEAAKAEQVATFLQDLFAVSDPSQSLGETITARELLDEGAERVERELADQPEVRATMMRLMGNVYHALGLMEQARPLLEQALEDHRQLYGESHREVAETELTLASLVQDMGELEAAEALMLRGLETRRRLFGEQSPEVVEGLSMLAFLLETRGDLEGAEQLFREAVAISRVTLPPDDPYVAETKARLAGMLRRDGNLDEAEPLLREALAAQRATYGDLDLDVASTARNLASLLRDRATPESLAEAEALYEEVLATRRRILGDAHPEVAVARNSYAILLDRVGDLDGAVAQYRELVRILEQSATAGSRLQADLAAIYNNLAATLRLQGELDEAAAIYDLALQTVDEALDEDHPNRAFARIGLAEVLADQGEHAAAESLFREGLAIRRRTLPDGHRYIGDALVDLGECLMLQERFDEAESAFVEARELFLESLGEDDGRTRTAVRMLETLGAARSGADNRRP